MHQVLTRPNLRLQSSKCGFPQAGKQKGCKVLDFCDFCWRHDQIIPNPLWSRSSMLFRMTALSCRKIMKNLFVLHHIASQCTVLHHIAYIAMYSQYCTVLFLIRRNKIGADSCQTFPPARVTVFRTGSEEPLEARRDKLWKMLALVEGKAADMTQQF